MLPKQIEIQQIRAQSIYNQMKQIKKEKKSLIYIQENYSTSMNSLYIYLWLQKKHFISYSSTWMNKSLL